jgi:hypothetical protein
MLYPVITYLVRYPDCTRVAEMAFLSQQDASRSERFMRRSQHYLVLRRRNVSAWQLELLGLTPVGDVP